MTVKRLVEIEPVAIKCEMAVRYDEENIPNDFPLRNGDMWTGVIDIATGIIRNWPKGKSGVMSMKVCDEGTYTLLGANDEALAVRENDYVPSCVPEQYGDYVEFNISEDGKINNWFDYCTEENVAESFFNED